jgi:hypothetical protein
VVASLVLVEGEHVIEEDLILPLANTEAFQVGRVDGFGFLVHFVTNSTRDHDAALKALSTEVPNVTGVLTHATRVSA